MTEEDEGQRIEMHGAMLDEPRRVVLQPTQTPPTYAGRDASDRNEAPKADVSIGPYRPIEELGEPTEVEHEPPPGKEQER